MQGGASPLGPPSTQTRARHSSTPPPAAHSRVSAPGRGAPWAQGLCRLDPRGLGTGEEAA